MRLPLVTLLPVILLAVTTSTFPQPSEPAPPVGTDDGAVGGSQQTLPVSQPVISQDLTPSPSVNNASPTIDKTETVDQSPDPPNDDVFWDVTGSPTERLSSDSQESAVSSFSPTRNYVFEEETLPSTAGSNQSSSSHIEMSGILISIDGVPTFEPNRKPSSLQSSRVEETISLGPTGISSILHEIISTSILQTTSDKTTHLNRSDIQGLVSTASSIPVEQPPTSFTSLSNNTMSLQRATDNATRNSERGVSSPSPPSLRPEDKMQDIYHGPLKSGDPYAHWDSDSEEQEHEMELERLPLLNELELEQYEDDSAVVRTSANTVDVDVGPPTSPSPSTPTNGRSYLLLLAGNSTIVQLRQKDFAKYLKLNLAARLSLEYDDVRVNRVVLAPPQLLVNVSVVTPSEAPSAAINSEEVISEAAFDDAVLKEEEPLHMLAETNATLLELSGEEYHVVRLLSLHSHPSEKKLEIEGDLPSTATIISDRQSNTELIIYTAIGSVCALVILAILFMTFSRYLRTFHVQWPWQRPKSLYSSWTLPSSHLRHRRMDQYPSATVVPPTVIYSGSFAARAANSWVDEYHSQSSIVLADDACSTAMLGVGALKLPAGNPLYTDLEMGGAAGNIIMGHKTETLSMQRHQSPSKLHMFSCRPGSIVIPAVVPHHQVRRNLQVTKHSHPLDAGIREDCKLGHDNPNYLT